MGDKRCVGYIVDRSQSGGQLLRLWTGAQNGTGGRCARTGNRDDVVAARRNGGGILVCVGEPAPGLGQRYARTTWLLVAGGAITAIPLIAVCHRSTADELQRARLHPVSRALHCSSCAGWCSMEKRYRRPRLVSFGLIWLALGIFSWEAINAGSHLADAGRFSLQAARRSSPGPTAGGKFPAYFFARMERHDGRYHLPPIDRFTWCTIASAIASAFQEQPTPFQSAVPRSAAGRKNAGRFRMRRPRTCRAHLLRRTPRRSFPAQRAR